MRRYLGYLILLFFGISCNDGNIDVTTFNYNEETVLSKCGSTDLVLYNINNTDVNEAISLKLGSNPFPGGSDTLTAPLTDKTISLTETGTNVLVYRTFDGNIPSDYFCNSIPPGSPKVITEFRAVGGTVKISSSPKVTEDQDGDGLKNVDEGMDSNQDTDGDGIPDYLDIDDDGDNVKTSVELRVSDNPTENGYGDTDGDGIPNYLDPDDDGDGVPTKLEVTEDNQDPATNTNDAGRLKYLDEFSDQKFTGNLTYKLKNAFNQSFTSLIVIQNLELKNETGDGGQISYTNFTLGTFTSSYPFLIEPDTTTTAN